MSLVISDLLGGDELPLLPNPCGLAIPSIVSSDNMRRHLHSQLPKDRRAKRSLLHGLRGGGDLLEEPPQNERRVFEKANLNQSLFAQWLDQATQLCGVLSFVTTVAYLFQLLGKELVNQARRRTKLQLLLFLPTLIFLLQLVQRLPSALGFRFPMRRLALEGVHSARRVVGNVIQNRRTTLGSVEFPSFQERAYNIIYASIVN
mmetsp:Transcript_6285/g.9789  ORF Transcript_6285/g.9789 Transcript_6285/m.9789 type:complete len:203 (-) Transcript_6285:546-1154(-)